MSYPRLLLSAMNRSPACAEWIVTTQSVKQKRLDINCLTKEEFDSVEFPARARESTQD